MKVFTTLVAAVLFSSLSSIADTYHSIAVKDLGFEADEATMKPILGHSITLWNQQQVEVRLPVEAYLKLDFGEDNQLFQSDALVIYRQSDEAPKGGVIDLGPYHGGQMTHAYSFTIDPGKAKPATEADFVKARNQWARARSNQNLPGTAWFLHRAGEREEGNDRRVTRANLDDSFGVFGGGRAISENLALDRDLILGIDSENKGEPVPIADITGVTVAAIDWSDQLPDGEIATDPLGQVHSRRSARHLRLIAPGFS